MLLKNEKEEKKKWFPAYVNDDWRSYFHRRSYISSYSLLVDAVYGEPYQPVGSYYPIYGINNCDYKERLRHLAQITLQVMLARQRTTASSRVRTRWISCSTTVTLSKKYYLRMVKYFTKINLFL